MLDWVYEGAKIVCVKEGGWNPEWPDGEPYEGHIRSAPKYGEICEVYSVNTHPLYGLVGVRLTGYDLDHVFNIIFFRPLTKQDTTKEVNKLKRLSHTKKGRELT